MVVLSSLTKYVFELIFSPLLFVKKYKIKSEFFVLTLILIPSPLLTDFSISIFSIDGASAFSNLAHSPFLNGYESSSNAVTLIVLDSGEYDSN